MCLIAWSFGRLIFAMIFWYCTSKPLLARRICERVGRIKMAVKRVLTRDCSGRCQSIQF